jgi:CzcA family heavy metal efflux pump
MLNSLIAWSLRNRGLILCLALTLVGVALFRLTQIPLDVFPELRAPVVTIMTEAPGFAAEEVEQAVTFPLETALNGLAGIRRVRSTSAIGLSIVWAEFGFEADVYRARQLIAERLAQVQEILPDDVQSPTMTPISSITGEILLLALTSPEDTVSQLELRRIAEFDLRTRLLAVSGVAQITALGGEFPEYQVLVEPLELQRYGLSLKQVEQAVGAAHTGTAGGVLTDVQGRELPLRIATRASSAEDLAQVVVGEWQGVPVTLGRIAQVALGPAPSRGTGSSNGKSSVILTIKKNPGVNTLVITRELDLALDEFEKTCPDGVVLDRHVFRQSDFVQVAINNVLHAVRDGVIFVLIILVLFLMNVRTTLITLTALPLSLGATLLILDGLGETINVMTLGGIAVAIGSLVDDAIVDVENVFRRLRLNAQRPVEERQPALRVVYQASVEVRPAIMLATALIVLVFVPLFFLSGVEGRFFRPLGTAYVISLAASLLVAMTVTPVLCSWLLPSMKHLSKSEGAFPRWLQQVYAALLQRILRWKKTVMAVAIAAITLATLLASTFGTSFLPDFNEGSVTVFLNLPAGSSLPESNRLAYHIEQRILKIPGVATVTRRTGRAENDEHAEPVSASELDVRLQADVDLAATRQQLTQLFRAIPGVTAQLGGPISHRLSHILSGTPAAIAIKVFGEDIDQLREIARKIEGQLRGLPGVRDLVANREVLIDTLPVIFDRQALSRYGLTPEAASAQMETAFRGRTLGTLLQEGARYDLVLRLADEARDHPEDVAQFLLQGPSGALVRVAEVARVHREQASNLLTRENVRRKAVISCNVDEGHNLGDLVGELRQRVDPIVQQYPGTFVEYGGQFEAQEEATRTILLVSLAVLAVVAGLLFAAFGSIRPVALILFNLPLALVGGCLAMFLADSDQPLRNLAALISGGDYTAPVLSIASLVGFIGLGGIACRNGLLLISHYYHLMEAEGVPREAAVVRAAHERLLPILMTALSSALALVPLVLAEGEMGSELQYPLAVVMLGGLASSTLLNLAVIPVGLALFGGDARDRSPDQDWSLPQAVEESKEKS